MSDSTSLRLPVALLERLKGIREQLVKSAARRPGKANPALQRGLVGMADVVAELCYRYERDRSRNAYYQSCFKRRQRGEPPLPPPEVSRMLDEGCPNG